jgi:hypothetical protein
VDDPFNHWKVAMLVNGLHAEFEIKDETSEVEPVRNDEVAPGWVDQLDEAPPDAV